MSDHSKRIYVISDNSKAMMRAAYENMQLHINEFDHNSESAVRACKANWGLLIIESSYDVYDAIKLCKTIRAAKPTGQIFILSRQCADSVISDSFMHGADDHICSPVSEAVFQAKIRSALRRSAVLQHTTKNTKRKTNTLSLSAGSDVPVDTASNVTRNIDELALFQIIPASKMAIINGNSIMLTKTELSIFSYLINNINAPCEKIALLEHVLGYKDECYLTSLYSHINRLRRKLVKANLPTIRIKTIWRYGYELVVD